MKLIVIDSFMSSEGKNFQFLGEHFLNIFTLGLTSVY